MSKGFIGEWKAFASLFVEILRDYGLKKIDNRYLNFSSSFNIASYNREERVVYLKSDEASPIYGLELSAGGNISKRVDNLNELMKNYRYDETSKVTLFYVKNPIIDEEAGDNFYAKHSIYLFGAKRQLLEDIAYTLDGSMKLMTVEKLYQAFFDLGFINHYSIDKNNMTLKSLFHFGNQKIDTLNLYFKAIFAEGVYGALCKNENPLESNYHLYQGVASDGAFNLGNPNLHQLFKLDWKGYIAFNIDFSHEHIEEGFNDTLRSVKNAEQDKKVRKGYTDAAEFSGNLVNESIYLNIVMAIDNHYLSNTISKILNTTFIPKNTRRKDILYSTPLLKRDTVYDFLAPTNEVGKLFQVIHKKHNSITRTTKNLYGKDLSGNFINLSFSQAGAGLHWAIVAPTRSGKTFTILKVISQSIKAKIVKKEKRELIIARKNSQTYGSLFIGEKIKKAEALGDVKLVHFDTGQSCLKFVTELKERYPDKVYIDSDDVGQLRFSLLNIEEEITDNGEKILSEDDILFGIAIINLLLSLNEEVPLSSSEQAEFKGAIYRVFYETGFRGETLYELKNLGGYEEVIERIYKYAEKKGVKISDKTRTTDPELNLKESKLSFMTKPTLSSIIKELTLKSKSERTDSEEVTILGTLVAKLKPISSLKMFNYYDNNNVMVTDYYYTELERLRNLGNNVFLPAFLITFQRFYKRDLTEAKRLKALDKPLPEIIYILEEADSYIKLKILEEIFERITREASRYSIFFGFITQFGTDIPKDILGNIHTRMVLSSPYVKKDELAYYWAGDKKDGGEGEKESEFYLKNREKFLVFCKSGDDVLTFKHYVSEEEANLFNSNAKAVVEESEDDMA